MHRSHTLHWGASRTLVDASFDLLCTGQPHAKRCTPGPIIPEHTCMLRTHGADVVRESGSDSPPPLHGARGPNDTRLCS